MHRCGTAFETHMSTCVARSKRSVSFDFSAPFYISEITGEGWLGDERSGGGRRTADGGIVAGLKMKDAGKQDYARNSCFGVYAPRQAGTKAFRRDSQLFEYGSLSNPREKRDARRRSSYIIQKGRQSSVCVHGACRGKTSVPFIEEIPSRILLGCQPNLVRLGSD